MCGRFTLTRHDLREVAALLGAFVSDEDAAAHRPRYNVAPSARAWLLVDEGAGRRIEAGRWGFPPPWGPRQADPVGLINVRAETAAEKPSFREAWRRRRCAVIADGFFEWRGGKGHKEPLWLHRPGGELLLFAGLWRESVDEEGVAARRFAILTTAANELVAPIHARMPAILGPEALSRWLSVGPGEGLDAALGPAPAGLLVATPVSTRVNDARFDDPLCVASAPGLFDG